MQPPDFYPLQSRKNHNELPVLDLGLDSLCFAIIVSRLETVLRVDPFSESDDAPFPANLG
jgi:hypothetical protein